MNSSLNPSDSSSVRLFHLASGSLSTALFVHQVNGDFTQLMGNIFRNPNAVGACCTDTSMLRRVTAMDEKLELIQKSLDQYLETKR